MARPRTIAFDFGETLAYYEGAGLNWAEHYDSALTQVATRCGQHLTSSQLQDAKHVLARYNTRLAPREYEVPSTTVFAEILATWQLESIELIDTAIDAFFGYFRRSLRVYPDTLPALENLRRHGHSLGVLTDVPYGMPKRFIEEDLARAGLLQLFDYVLTSTEAGRRKPHPDGLLQLAAHFRAACDEVVYVGNEPKDMEAARQAGMLPIFVDREGTSSLSNGLRTVRSLGELAQVLGVQ
jgi:putative hydrolase of the HAD superfamily